jgi:hypothetical protein
MPLLKQMHADLCALGFEGAYCAIARFAREWRRQQLELSKGASKHTYIPLQLKPGEAAQFDWSEDVDANLWHGAGGNVADGY